MPTSYTALTKLLARQGRFAEAIRQCRTAEKVAEAIDPKYAPPYYNNEGQILQQCGRFEESIPLLQKAVELAGGEYTDAECNLAKSLLATGQAEEAAKRYLAAIGRAPDCAEAHCGLGQLLYAAGKFDAAMGQFKTALKINEKSADAHIGVAQTLLKGPWAQAKEALTHYRRAAEIEPTNIEALKGVAVILGQSPLHSLRDGAEALKIARRADDLTGHRRPDVLQVLAGAYSEAGQLDEAIATTKKALDLAIEQKQPQLERLLRELLRLYENQK